MWWTQALLAAVVWGLDYALAERILKRGISPAGLLCIQMFAGAVLMAVTAWATSIKRDLQILYNDRGLWWLTGAVIAAFALGNLLVATAIQRKNATVSALVEIAYPLFVVLFSWLFFRQVHVNVGVVAGGVLVALGIVIIARTA